MNSQHPFAARCVAYGLVFLLALAPEIASAQDSSSPAAPAPQTTTQTQPPADAAAPQQTPAAPLPDSPSTAQPTPAAETPRSSQTRTDAPQRPVGTAAAEIGSAGGPAASKPAGVAIAPAKQRQTRSFLIKVGAIVGVGVAIGTVFALSNASPGRPPNSQ